MPSSRNGSGFLSKGNCPDKFGLGPIHTCCPSMWIYLFYYGDIALTRIDGKSDKNVV